MKKRELEERVERLERLVGCAPRRAQIRTEGATHIPGVSARRAQSDPIRNGILTRLEKLERGSDFPMSAERGCGASAKGDARNSPGQAAHESDEDKARQPDEPMADMPETCPDCDDEYPGECATCKPETGPSDYKHFDGVDQAREWVFPALHETVVAERNQLREEVRLLKSERDEARTARDGVEQYWDRKYAATRDMCAEYRAERDRLREGLLRVADETEARFGQSKQVLDLRALLDGDDE